MSSQISVTLSPNTDPIWRACFGLIHEMKVTVQNRRIFPTLEYCINGLGLKTMYKLCLQLAFVDNKLVKYKDGKWVESISTEAKDVPRTIWMEEKTGEQLMSGIVSFDHARITNRKSKEDMDENIIHLHGLHRYIPVLTIFEGDKVVHTSMIPHTMFLTGTQYHNKALIAVKDANNKYSMGYEKRKYREEQKKDKPEEKRVKIEDTTTSDAKITQNGSLLDQPLLVPTSQSDFKPDVTQVQFNKPLPVLPHSILPIGHVKPGKTALVSNRAIPTLQHSIHSIVQVKQEDASSSHNALSPIRDAPIAQNGSLLDQLMPVPVIPAQVKPDLVPFNTLFPMLPQFGQVGHGVTPSPRNSPTLMLQPQYGFPINPFFNPMLPPFNSVWQTPPVTPEEDDEVDVVN